MTKGQFPLFSPPTLRRNTDPGTSHRAADEIQPVIAHLTRWAANCVRAHPGSTANELSAIYEQNDSRRIGRRLDGAVKAGMVVRGGERRCKVSGRYCTIWNPPPCKS